MSEFVLIEEAPNAGRKVSGDATIGREGCDVLVSDSQASRTHAAFRLLAAGPAIEDLNSTNGTFVNDERIAGQKELRAGDKIRIGETRWRLESVQREAVPDPSGPDDDDKREDSADGKDSSRGDVPPPVPSAIRRAEPLPHPVQAPGFGVGAPASRVRGSAARRAEATVVSYAVVLLTAIAVIAYFAAR